MTDFGTPPNAIYEDDLIGEHIPFGDVSFNLMEKIQVSEGIQNYSLLNWGRALTLRCYTWGNKRESQKNKSKWDPPSD